MESQETLPKGCCEIGAISEGQYQKGTHAMTDDRGITSEGMGVVGTFVYDCGFLVTSSGRLFVPATGEKGYESLIPGKLVSFTRRYGSRGFYADNVEVLPLPDPMEPPPSQSVPVVTVYLAAFLGEIEREPVAVIAKVVRFVGIDAAWNLLRSSLQIEAEGGMRIADGSRRRTPGGVFFQLARENHQWNPWQQKPRNQRMTWRERGELIDSMRKREGEKGNVQPTITIIGRPDHVVTKHDLTMAMFTQRGAIPNLRRNVPEPDPESETTYVIYIGGDLWNGMTKHLGGDPSNGLIITGCLQWDSEFDAIAVFADSVTTTKIKQRNKKKKEHAETSRS